MTSTPSWNHDQLREYVQGRLSAQDREAIDQQIEKYPETLSVLQALERETDPFLVELRESWPTFRYGSEPSYQEAIRRAQRIPLDVDASQRALPDLPQLREYTLVEILGQGAMGVVYKALQNRLGRHVAIKLMTANPLESPGRTARFEQEMLAIGKLEHPNIVRALEAGEADDVLYLVMEYIPGYTFSELLRTEKDLPVPFVCELIRQAAEGLEAAHKQTCIHRDIKPSNLMLSEAGEVKLLDLGLAKILNPTAGEELTAEGWILGTIDYMSPEQGMNAAAADARSDVYSLGCTFYKLLTGRAPFERPNSTPLATLSAHTNEPVTSPRQLRPDVSVEIETMIMQMLEKQPDRRPQTADEVAKRLKPWVTGTDLPGFLEKMSRHSPPTPPSTADWQRDGSLPTQTEQGAPAPRRSSRGFQFLVGGVILALLVGLFFAFSQITLRIESEDGVLVVELADDSVEARIRGKTIVLYDTKTNKRHTVTLAGKDTRQKLPPGKYKVEVSEEDGIKLKMKEFTIARGKEQVVRVYAVEPTKIVKNTKPKPPPSTTKTPKDPPKAKGPDPRADETEWVMAITTKLNAKLNVKIQGFGFLYPRLIDFRYNYSTDLFLSQFSTRYGGVLVDLGSLTWLHVPQQSLKTIEAEEKQHVITLKTGLQFRGELLTNLRTADGKVYDLRSVKQAEIVPPRTWKEKPFNGKAKWVFQTPVLPKREFPVHYAQFLSFGINHRFTQWSNAFQVTIDGEAIQGNLDNFEKVSVVNKDGQKIMTLTAPNAEPIEGSGISHSPLVLYGMDNFAIITADYFSLDRTGIEKEAPSKP